MKKSGEGLACPRHPRSLLLRLRFQPALALLLQTRHAVSKPLEPGSARLPIPLAEGMGRLPGSSPFLARRSQKHLAVPPRAVVFGTRAALPRTNCLGTCVTPEHGQAVPRQTFWPHWDLDRCLA